MKQIIKLPIQPNPQLTSFSYYAFMQSIISAEDKIGDEFARFQIVGTPYSNWEIGGNIQKINETVFCGQTEDKYRRDCNGYVVREMHTSDYLDVQIDYQQYTNPWAAVNLFVTDDRGNVLLGDEAYLFRFGHFKYIGTALYQSGENRNIPSERYKEPYRLVIEREGDFFQFYSGCGNVKKRTESQLESISKKLYIGIQVRHEENSYYPWLFSNFIQLGCDVNNPDRRLDYVFGIAKHWENSDISYFLDKNRYTAEEVSWLGGNKYLIWCLKQGKYIETKVDHYYLEGREEYMSIHHYHQVLIYGVDEKRREFLLLGYNDRGKLQMMQMSFVDFRKSLEQRKDILYKTIQYEQDGHFYKFNIQYFREMLHQYLESIDSCFYYQNTEARDTRTYGRAIYEELKTETGIKVLIEDRRIAHVLWEHKHMMCERIQYLISENYLPVGSEDLYDKMREIEQEVFDLKNVLLKYQIRPERIREEKICQFIDEICEKEAACLQELYNRIGWRLE